LYTAHRNTATPHALGHAYNFFLCQSTASAVFNDSSINGLYRVFSFQNVRRMHID
jgi:hypothetical protein